VNIALVLPVCRTDQLADGVVARLAWNWEVSPARLLLSVTVNGDRVYILRLFYRKSVCVASSGASTIAFAGRGDAHRPEATGDAAIDASLGAEMADGQESLPGWVSSNRRGDGARLLGPRTNRASPASC